MPGYYPHQLPYAPELLDGQFLLCTRPELVPRGWRSFSHGRWLLAWSAPLTTTPFRDRSGRTRGWLVGHAVHPELGWIAALDSIVLEPADQAGFDAVVNQLSGRFIAISLMEGAPSVFLDALGSLAAVFAPEEECLASTQSLIPVTARTPFDIDRILWTDIPHGESMYPVGMTPRRGVERVLPNHVLHAGDWRHVRIWPTGEVPRKANLTEVAERMGRDMQQTLRATARVLPLDFALTAGWDTRLILSCARELLDDATFFTANLGDADAWRDVVVSQQLAARFGLRHRVLPYRRSRARDLRAWAIRTGGEVAESRGWRGCRTLAEQRPGSAAIVGTGGNQINIGNQRREESRRGVSAETVLRRCRVRPRPDFLAQADRWVQGIPATDSELRADLIFLEQREACWGGIIEYGELGRTSARFCPIGTIRSTRALLSLPVADRDQHGVHRRIMEQFWPELLEVPFNQNFAVSGPRIGFYNFQDSVRRRTARLRRVVRKTRARPQWLLDRLGVA